MSDEPSFDRPQFCDKDGNPIELEFTPRSSIAYAEWVTWQRRCADCQVGVGEFHLDGCDVAECRITGRQRLMCDHAEEDSCNTRWRGIWPGEAECVEYGWYARMVPGLMGWHRCEKDDEGAMEDLNRLSIECVWNVEEQRMVKPGE